MSNRLFAYGTLLAPELFSRIVGREILGTPSVLQGYACYRVRRAAYPAITMQAGAVTHGKVFDNIDAGEWGNLDEFETDLYDRREVTVVLDDNTLAPAQTYVIAARFRERLTKEPWNLALFREKHLRRYLKHL